MQYERENKGNKSQNQDGVVGKHTAPPRTTRTHKKKSNVKEVQHQGDKR